MLLKLEFDITPQVTQTIIFWGLSQNIVHALELFDQWWSDGEFFNFICVMIGEALFSDFGTDFMD